jgi:hypothetical protein
MAADKQPFQSLTGIAEQLAQHSMERAQGAMKNYFGWLQSAMSAAPWGNTDLNKKLLDYAEENTAAALEFVQKLTRAKNWEEVTTIQAEFVSTQLNSLNEQAKNIGNACTKTVGTVTKTPFGMST